MILQVDGRNDTAEQIYLGKFIYLLIIATSSVCRIKFAKTEEVRLEMYITLEELIVIIN